MSADRAARLARLREVPGCDWRTGEDAMAPYLAEQRGLYRGAALAVALPQDTAAVSALVRACVELDLTLVPQGGNTGLCGGAVAQDADRQVIVSLERLDRIRAVDAANFTLAAEAGCIVQRVRDAAAAHDRLFPLSFGADGSARLGGAISTNAGGTNVLRYGNARELTLGLEVVLADGRVWDGLTALRKDNTGYDLKHLFIGAEGTLGIITAAVLKRSNSLICGRTSEERVMCTPGRAARSASAASRSCRLSRQEWRKQTATDSTASSRSAAMAASSEAVGSSMKISRGCVTMFLAICRRCRRRP